MRSFTLINSNIINAAFLLHPNENKIVLKNILKIVNIIHMKGKSLI